MTWFEVPECVVQTYPDADGKRWWRYCLTCDDGSNKHGKHRRGHRTEADAKMSAKMHIRDKRAVRLARARYADWQRRILAESDPAAFAEIFYERFPEFRWGRGARGLHPLNIPGIMRTVQVDLRARWESLA